MSENNLNVTTNNEENVVIKVYYSRADKKESEWNVWAWALGFFAKEFKFEVEDGKYVATITIPKKLVHSINSVSYKIRKGDWVDQEDERTVDLKCVLSGTVVSSVDADGNYTTDTTNAVLGVKLNLIEYDRSTNKITVTASQDVPEVANAFVITDKGEEIAKYLISTSPRGVTLIDTIGAYKNQSNKMLFCALKDSETEAFQRKILEIDETAFVVFSESQKIVGNGFYLYK